MRILKNRGHLFLAVLALLGSAPLSALDFNNSVGVRIDDSGNSIAVWEAQSGNLHTIKAATKSVLGNWGSVKTVSAVGKDSFNPVYDINFLGKAVVVWTVKDAGVRSLYGSTLLLLAGNWTAPILLSSGTKDVTNYSVKIDKLNDIIAVWSEQVGSTETTYSSSAVLGGIWGAAVQIQ